MHRLSRRSATSRPAVPRSAAKATIIRRPTRSGDDDRVLSFAWYYLESRTRSHNLIRTPGLPRRDAPVLSAAVPSVRVAALWVVLCVVRDCRSLPHSPFEEVS